MDQCYEKGNRSQKKHLKHLYKTLTSKRKEFYNTNTYRKINNS